MRAENIQLWLVAVIHKERPDTSKWDQVADIIQTAFRDRSILVDYAWKTFVLIPKVNGEFLGISLFEVIWKAVLVVFNRWIRAAVNFCDALHGLRAGWGVGNNSLEANLTQNLKSMRVEVLYEIFIYLWKAYYVLDRYCLINRRWYYNF